MLIITGITFIIIGLIFKLFPPKKINSIYGHRTKFSMKNQNTWDEAQRFSANSFIILGFINAALGFLMNLLIKIDTTGYQFVIFLAGTILVLIVDEGHLRKVFYDNGTRRH